MRPDARGIFALVFSLLVAAALGLVITHLRDATSRRPQPISMPMADAR